MFTSIRHHISELAASTWWFAANCVGNWVVGYRR